MKFSPRNGVRPDWNARELADFLGLAPATVSMVIHRSANAYPIPETTRRRILATAREWGIPVQSRTAEGKRSFSIGVLVPELADGYFTHVMHGVEEHLLRAGYLHFIVSHQRRPDLLKEYETLLVKREVDGLLLVNTALPTEALTLPAVSISGHDHVDGVTNVMLDHDKAALLALKHLYELGHRRICFMKGQQHAGDSDFRWRSIARKAKVLDLAIDPELCVYLQTNSWSPDLGYHPVMDLLKRRRDFTAIFCFNDISAIGAIRAIHDSGLVCPRDISVVGFDDISAARFHLPSITTVRQPLKRMGELAAQVLLGRVQNPADSYPDTLVIQPELEVRESTGPAPVTHSVPAKRARAR